VRKLKKGVRKYGGLDVRMHEDKLRKLLGLKSKNPAISDGVF
jgi:hypothetical protein